MREGNGDGKEGSWYSSCVGSQTSELLWTRHRQGEKVNAGRRGKSRSDMGGHPKQICLIRSLPSMGLDRSLIQQPSGCLWVIYKVN